MSRRIAVPMLLAAGLVLAACSSSSSPAHRLAQRYLAIATPANAKLDKAFDALEDGDEHDVAKAGADYRLAATTERAFDRDLLAMTWPAAIAATVQVLVRVNEARAGLTEQAAAATTLDQLEALEPDLDFANGVVEDQVVVIRQQLGLPPPDTD